MTTAWVLSGGASLGSVQVGMAQALGEHDVQPDLIVGTSVGAINGAWFAGGGDAETLAEVWRSLRRSTLFPTRPLLGMRAFAGRTNHSVPDTGLRRLLRRHVSFSRLEEAPIRFAVVAADSRSGHEVVIQHGDAIDAIMASAAIPGAFRPVEIDGRLLIDGGVANNTPISTAIELGATEVWVLSTAYSCALAATPTTAFSMAMQAVAFMVQRRLVLELQTVSYDVPVHLVPPPCPVTVGPIDFSQTAQLIDRSIAGTRQWLDNGCPDAMPLLAPHVHSDPALPHRPH